MSLAFGSVAVLTTATPVAGLPLSAQCITFTNSGANPVVLGGPGVTAASSGPGVAVIPANQSVTIPQAGTLPTKLNAIATATGNTLSWFIGESTT